MESKPAKVEVGQRWQGPTSKIVWEVTAVDAKGARARVVEKGSSDRGVGDESGHWPLNTFMSTLKLLGHSPQSKERGMVMEVDAKGFPARCLACDGAKPSHLAYLCSHCVRYSDFNLRDAAAEWKAGDRAFPRSPRIPMGEGESFVDHGEPASAASTASDIGMPHPTGCMCEQCKRDRKPKREVSTNGRDWLPYDGYLADSDPFEAYKHRRLDGVVVAMEEPRGYHGETWAEHLEHQQFQRGDMLMGDRFGARQDAAARRREAPSSPSLSCSPGENIPETHAYHTPTRTPGAQ